MMGAEELMQILESADSIYRQLIIPYVRQAIMELCQPGGEIYTRIESTMIDSANEWYGMYTPTYYRRGYTISDPGYMDVEISNLDVSDTGGSVELKPKNNSPHFHWTRGFPMRNGLYRPGMDVLADADALTFDMVIHLPQQVLDSCMVQALSTAIAQYT